MNLRLMNIISPSIYIILFESNKISPANFSQFPNIPQQKQIKNSSKNLDMWIFVSTFATENKQHK